MHSIPVLCFVADFIEEFSGWNLNFGPNDRYVGSIRPFETFYDNGNPKEFLINDNVWMFKMTKYQTEQEKFWAGSFGNSYIERNVSDALLKANIAFFTRVLSRVGPIDSIIEFGANVGMNIRALNFLLPNAELHAVEINQEAANHLKTSCSVNVHTQTLIGFLPEHPLEMSFTKGVLIHIAPEILNDAYDALYASSSRFILIAEYYNPVPVSIPYRGYDDRLFKRDFAGEMLDRYSDLSIVDYGFLYHRDPHFPQDDINWFLMEKR